jgi:serine/threonine protein kinase
VAVKVLREGFPDESEAVQRLRDEGRLLSVLDHPAILKVHDICRLDGRIALVAEYIEGVDLTWFTRVGRLAPEVVVAEIVGAVAGALDAAFRHPSPRTGRPLELLHRDIKPENIRIGPGGVVKLLDFGLARTTELYRYMQTLTDDVPFTPGYAPPETLSDGIQGPEADIYALGVTAYRALAGERLYEGLELPDQVRVATVPARYDEFLRDRLAVLRSDSGMRLLVAQMLARNREQRPTAAQVRSACSVVMELDDVDLAGWLSSQRLPDARELDAGLTGRTVTEEPLSSGRNPPSDWKQEKRDHLARSASQVPPPVRGDHGPVGVPTPRPVPDVPDHLRHGKAVVPDEEDFDLLGVPHPSVVPAGRRFDGSPAVTSVPAFKPDPRSATQPRIMRTTGTAALPRRKRPRGPAPSAASGLLAAASQATEAELPPDPPTAEIPRPQMTDHEPDPVVVHGLPWVQIIGVTLGVVGILVFALWGLMLILG